jgi:hypothetical protein
MRCPSGWQAPRAHCSAWRRGRVPCFQGRVLAPFHSCWSLLNLRVAPFMPEQAPTSSTSADCLRVPHIARRSAERVPTSPQCRTCAFSSTQDLHAHEDSRVPQPLRPMIEVTASTSSISIGDLLQVKASYARLSSRAPPSLWHSEEHLESQLSSLRLSHYPRFSHCREPSRQHKS